MENIKIKNIQGDILNIDLRYKPGIKNMPLLIFCHGFKGFKDWGSFPYMLDKFAHENIFTVSFNFSLNGMDNNKSHPIDFERLDLFAQNTFSRELDDLGCVLSFLEKKKDFYGYDFDNLILAGHSRGGGIAILKTAEDKRIKKLITLASVSDFYRYGEETRKMWKDRGYIEALNTRTNQRMRMNVSLLEDLENNPERLNIKSAMEKIDVPVLIIHGEEDLAVTIDEADELYNLRDKKPTQLYKLPNTGHTFGAAHPFTGTNDKLNEVIKLILDFINIQLKNTIN